MNWELVPGAIVTGILSGGIIGLIALGVVLIYKSSEIFNFAQGHMVMLGAFITWWFAGADENGKELFNLPLGLAIILAFVAVFLIGFLIERFALRPMTGQPLLSIVLMTLGLAQLIEGLALITFGQTKDNFPAPMSRTDTFPIYSKYAYDGIIYVKEIQVAVFFTAIIATILIALFFKFTRAGLAMRAASEDHELARSVGINVPRVFGLSWAIAGVIATTAGVLLAMLLGLSVNLAGVGFIIFSAILLGGLDSLPGAVVGGIIIGLVQELVKASTIYEINKSFSISPYILLLIVLVIRPEGLFGRKRIERI